MSSFLDTNVVVYLTAGDPAFADVSERLVRDGAIISVQVLNETARTLRGKLAFSWEEVGEFLEGLRAKCQVVPVSLATHERGLAYAERYGLNLFDAMIVAAAALAGCTTLYSEDMQDGLVIDRLTIRNPYAGPSPS